MKHGSKLLRLVEFPVIVNEWLIQHQEENQCAVMKLGCAVIQQTAQTYLY